MYRAVPHQKLSEGVEQFQTGFQVIKFLVLQCMSSEELHCTTLTVIRKHENGSLEKIG